MRKSICNSNKINTIFFFELYLLIIIMFLVTLIINNTTFLYCLILSTLCVNCILTINNWKNYTAYLLFNFCVFIFLLSKPIGAFLIGTDYIINLKTNDLIFCYCCYEVALLGLGLAGLMYRPKMKFNFMNITQETIYLRKVAFYFFLIGFLCVLYENFFKIRFFLRHSYLDFYNGEYTNDFIPGIIKIGIQMFRPAMCVYLVTFPEKRKSLFVLSLYIVCTIPEMIVGQRAPLMLALFFCIAYFGLRDSVKANNNNKMHKEWLSKRFVIICILLVPFIMLFLTLYNELRNNVVKSNIISHKLSHPIGWFLFEQGGTMDLVIDYLHVKSVIPKINYFFGYLYDTFMNNSIISTIIHRTVARPNTIEYVNQSHALATQLSYCLLGENYFKGMATDSSYILNIYSTFGYFGLIILSYMIGIYLCRFSFYFSKHKLFSIMVLYSYLHLFMIPRADIMSTFSFLVAPYFWFSVVVIYLFVKILKEKIIKFI